MIKIIKIIFVLILVVLVFAGVRTFSGDQSFVVTLDHWLDQFQEPIVESDELEENEAEESHDEDDDDDAPSRVEIYRDLPAVRISENMMQRSGIQTNSLQVVTHLNEVMATGSVIAFQPLLTLRTRYHQQQADLTLAKESLKASRKIFNRQNALHKQKANVSLKKVEQARYEVAKDNANMEAIKQQIKNIRIETIQAWGHELTRWALGNISHDPVAEDESSKGYYFDRLLDKKDVLVLITLPVDQALPDSTSFIYINTRPDRSAARKAYLISAASQTNPLSQGVTYYFRTHAKNLRVGMRLSAWIVLSDEVETGIDVPLTAVIWYGGQPWVYVQVEEDLYSRRPVADYRETDFGWFIQDAFEQDEIIVTQGGQLLLSEEMRWQIPDEDDD